MRKFIESSLFHVSFGLYLILYIAYSFFAAMFNLYTVYDVFREHYVWIANNRGPQIIYAAIFLQSILRLICASMGCVAFCTYKNGKYYKRIGYIDVLVILISVFVNMNITSEWFITFAYLLKSLLIILYGEITIRHPLSHATCKKHFPYIHEAKLLSISRRKQ